MKIDSIQNGVVIDHITAGGGMKLYHLLGLDTIDCSVALIRNVPSKKMGRKDIIKVDGDVTLNLDVIGYVDPAATVNIIRDGKTVEKKHLELPEKIVGVVKCKNPRCITTTEQELPQVFELRDREHAIYRCLQRVMYPHTKSSTHISHIAITIDR